MFLRQTVDRHDRNAEPTRTNAGLHGQRGIDILRGTDETCSNTGTKTETYSEHYDG